VSLHYPALDIHIISRAERHESSLVAFGEPLQNTECAEAAAMAVLVTCTELFGYDAFQAVWEANFAIVQGKVLQKFRSEERRVSQRGHFGWHRMSSVGDGTTAVRRAGVEREEMTENNGRRISHFKVEMARQEKL
jgi:hypothetical protein